MRAPFRKPFRLGPWPVGVILASGFVLLASCFHFGGSGRSATTAVTAASLVSRTPPLPLFVLRVAQNELALDDDASALVAAANRDADTAARPIDAARGGFLETVARGVEGDRPSSAAVRGAGDRLVQAVADAGSGLQLGIERIHGRLSANQRRDLVTLVRHREAQWSTLWEPNAAPTKNGHRWLEALAGEALGDAMTEMREDTIQTTRTWVGQVIATATARLADADDNARRRLLSELRTDTLSSVAP